MRQLLLKAASENRSYVFLQAAVPYLEQVPEDAQIRLLMVRHFASLGLIAPALELIDDRPRILADCPELEDSVKSLRSHPTGQVAWEQQASTFEKNLECVLERFECVRRHESALRREIHGLDLYRCTDGNYLLSRRIDNQPRRWLPGIYESVETARNASLCPEGENLVCFPYLIEGVGFGEAIRGVYDGTSEMFLTYTPHIHIIERNCAQFAVWLHLDDHRDMLSDPRLHLWIGKDAADRFIEYLRNESAQEIPREVIHQLGWAASSTRCGSHALETLTQERHQRVESLRTSIRKKLSSIGTFEYYADRFRNRHREPLRIFGLTSRYTTFLQYSMRDIQQSLENHGHEFLLSIEEDDHTPNVPYVHTLAQIESFTPDLILLIDHNRHEFDGVYDFPIPFCNWIQDDMPHLFLPDAGKKLGPYDIVVGLAARSRLAPAGYPDAQRHPVPVPVNHRIFSNEPVSPADLRKSECDISFVSNLSITPDAFLAEQLEKTSQPEIRRLLGALYETFKRSILQGWGPGSFRQTAGIIQQISQEMSLPISAHDANQVRREFADRLINIFFRHQPLEWASQMGLNLHLYGRGWESHPTLGKHAKGVADHGYHLRTIFQASKINLQLMPSCAIHQRLLEGLASGGFFLIRQTPFDVMGSLIQSIGRRCRDFGISTEDELWNTSNEKLHEDVRTLNDALYAPYCLQDGLVQEMLSAEVRRYRLEAECFLPRYGEVRFATRQEFENLVSTFLDDDRKRQQIASQQRQRVMETLTYDAIVEDILQFASDYFVSKAKSESLVSVR